jgi:hypothetical protein
MTCRNNSLSAAVTRSIGVAAASDKQGMQYRVPEVTMTPMTACVSSTTVVREGTDRGAAFRRTRRVIVIGVAWEAAPCGGRDTELTSETIPRGDNCR